MSERFWVVTESGDRYECVTPGEALVTLTDLDVPGKIVCDNDDPALSGTMLTIDADGRLVGYRSPVKAVP